MGSERKYGLFLMVDAFWLILIRQCVVTAVLAYLCSVSDSGRIFAYFD